MIHPGPKAPQRIQALRADLRPIRGILPAGATILQAVGDLFAGQGLKGGMLDLSGVICAPLRYVLPAHSTDGVHAAWYSAPHDLSGPASILRATASVGWREGASFLHCHGAWAAQGGALAMGHLLPQETILAEAAEVSGLGAAETWFEALPDVETAFTLFQPRGGASSGAGMFARLAPGEDVVSAVEALATRHGLREARIHGLGSIDHIRFTDGRRMACLATELRLEGAILRAGAAHIPIEAVEIGGAIAQGVLSRGENPVGVTLELIIEPHKEPL